MSLRQKSRMRMSPVKIIQPVNHSSAPSYLRRSQSESLPGIAGVSFGVQNTRGLGNMFGIKTKKSVPIDTRWNNKTFNSSSTQTSFDDENKYLEKIKMMHKENIQLNATLKERDDAIVKFSQMMHDKYEGELTTIKKQGQADISHRDEKIAKLKRQIADIFKERSWEHQQQLEELRKELNRLTEEAQLLRIRLKREEIYKRVCENCKILNEKLESAIVQSKQKDRAIEELQAVCRKFEKQLLAHEQLLKMDVNKKIRKTNT
ncbi:dynein regulatory complex protein 9-like isoform X3 [Ambystoma mexicanum]|uniref:dynein regulatory complex protein 9-like isoform X3 n=1 Tax=Ambystoma mexicanum TaxID=8296 RepID=UPI0037E8605B